MLVEPVAELGLLHRIVTAVHALVPTARRAGHGVRVGIDSAVDPDGARLGDELSTALRRDGSPVIRLRRNDFLRPRSIRHEHGADDPDAGWERWYDDGGLRRESLDPLGPGGAMTWVASLWDADTDRASRAPRQGAVPGTIAVVDGPFLLRWELADALDLVVHLQTSPAAQRRRLTDADEATRTVASWQRYLDEVDPVARASFVVRYDDPRHPALVTMVRGSRAV